MSNYMLLAALRKFALRRTLARTAYRAGLPIDIAIAALYSKEV